jgi:hypothetical protein
LVLNVKRLQGCLRFVSVQRNMSIKLCYDCVYYIECIYWLNKDETLYCFVSESEIDTVYLRKVKFSHYRPKEALGDPEG